MASSTSPLVCAPADDPRQLGFAHPFMRAEQRIRHLVVDLADQAGLSVEVLSPREGERRFEEPGAQPGTPSRRPRQLLLVRPTRRNHRWLDGGGFCARCNVERSPIFERQINGERLIVYQYLVLGGEWTRKRPQCEPPAGKGRGAHGGT